MSHLIKKCLLVGFLWVMGMSVALAQAIDAAEYFFDTDPGIGGVGTYTLTFTANENISLVNQNITIPSTLAPGLHHFYVRVRNIVGDWSTPERRPFFLISTSTGTTLTTDITQAEYFFDTDPGINAASPLSLASSTGPPDSKEWMNATIGTSGLSAGFHHLYVRVKYGDGRWSTTERRPFYLINAAGTPTYTTDITQAEYFFDTDPGINAASPLSLAGSTGPPDSKEWMNATIGTSGLSAGFHHLYVRVKYGDGRWSTTERRPFYIIPPIVSSTHLPKIQKLEYFVDTEPSVGVGNGLTVNITPTADVVSLVGQVLPLPPTCLTVGTHRLYTRVQNEQGEWSTTERADFTVINTDAAVTAVAVVSSACTLTANETVTVTVQNNGTLALNAGQISISLGITGANTGTYTATNPASIAVGATGTVTITGVNLSTAGMNAVGATLTLCNDNVASNDVLSINRLGNVTPTVALSSPASTVYGTTSVTLTATLSPAPSNGTIQFYINGNPVGSPATVASGVATLVYNPSALAAQNYAISASYSGSTDYPTVFGFCPTIRTNSTFGTLTITPRPLNFTGTRVYNGLNTFTAAQLTAGNIVNSDVVTLSGSATVASQNIGTYTSFATNGLTASNANYMVTGGTVNVSITPLTLTPSVTANNKTYDGNTTATATGTVATVIGAETVNLVIGSATFDTKNVGTGKTVTATGLSLSGSDAGNYVLSSTTATTTANINYNILTLTITANNKVYDGTTTAVLGTPTLATIVGMEVVNVNITAANFSDKNVANGKTVTATGLSLSGADAGNYILLAPTATTTANITRLTVTPSVVANNKVYDGNATATLSGGTIATPVGGDAVSLVFSAATFNNKDVGTAKPVTATGLSLTGGDAGNYLLSATTATTTANITQKALTITAENKTKAYGAALPPLTYVYSGFVGGDVAPSTLPTIVTTATASSSVGSYPIMVSGAVDANYAISHVAGTLSVTPVFLSITADNKTKLYGAALPTLTVTYSGLVNGNTATATPPTIGTMATPSSLIGVYAITVSGAVDANYTISYSDGSLTVTPVILTPSIVANNKAYNGNATATLSSQTVATVLSGETVNLVVGAANFSDKNIGVGKTVTATGLTLSGSHAGNYVLNSTTATTTANITAVTLTPTLVANNKEYDGNTLASLSSFTVAPVVGVEMVTLGFVAVTFIDKNVGVGKTVTAYGLSLGGADAGNYVLATNSATALANITPIALTPSILANSKPYDGTTTATVHTPTVATVLGGETVNLVVGAANFSNKNAGSGKTVTASILSLTGADAGNYVLNSATATTTANIAKIAATITANNASKCLNSAFSFGGTEFTTSGVLSGDVIATVTLTSGATAPSTAVGTYPIIPSSAVGTDVGNYFITYTEGSFSIIDCSPKVAIKVYLQGAYNTATGLMTDGLRTLNLIPTASPYSSAPFTSVAAFAHVNGGGGESATATAFNATDPDAIVDWVFVELRSATNSATVVATRAALLQRDGDVVATDGISELKFTTVAVGNYYIAVRHRNHVAVRSATTKNLTYLSTTSMDFTTSLSETLATASGTVYNALATMSNGKLAMWGGNVNSDGSTRRSGPASVNDITLITSYYGASTNPAKLNVYRREDVNMNGSVYRSGPTSVNDISRLTNYLSGNLIVTQPIF